MADDPIDPALTSTPAEPDLSLDEFQEEFPTEGAAVVTPEVPASDAPPPATVAPVDEAARNQRGQFVKTRQRARSQQATEADVPRIAELTKKLRETEAERDTLKAARSATPPPVATPAVAPPIPQKATPPLGRPNIDDFQDYGEYVEALADWKIAEARIKDRETAQHEAEGQRLASSWRERTEAAKTTYTDFEAVALQAPTAIPPGSLVDAWILEHKSGAHVLYHLQKHPDVLSSLLAMPLFDQVDALSLLAQRLTPGAPSPVATGVSATPHSSTPRPPTPVRTGSVRATHEPPGDEASLDEFEGFYGGPSARS